MGGGGGGHGPRPPIVTDCIIFLFCCMVDGVTMCLLERTAGPLEPLAREPFFPIALKQ